MPASARNGWKSDGGVAIMASMTAADRPVLEFWYEFASTYSYLAAARIRPLAAAAGIRIAWRPFLLGPIFAAQGWQTSPFNLYPAKGANMWRDMERLCARHALPLRRPSTFPRHSLLASRVALAGAEAGWIGPFTLAVYRANFAEDRDIADSGVIAALLKEAGAPDDALERAGTPAIKEALRAQTARAIELGLFGAPSFIADGEVFWGNDRLEQAIEWAAGHRRAG